MGHGNNDLPVPSLTLVGPPPSFPAPLQSISCPGFASFVVHVDDAPAESKKWEVIATLIGRRTGTGYDPSISSQGRNASGQSRGSLSSIRFGGSADIFVGRFRHTHECCSFPCIPAGTRVRSLYKFRRRPKRCRSPESK